jgi:hypothetical protein
MSLLVVLHGVVLIVIIILDTCWLRHVVLPLLLVFLFVAEHQARTSSSTPGVLVLVVVPVI